MTDYLRSLGDEDALEGVLVTDVGLVEASIGMNVFSLASPEVVNDGHIVACSNKRVYDVGTYEARPTGYEDRLARQQGSPVSMK
jgi:hypothetical protein